MKKAKITFLVVIAIVALLFIIFNWDCLAYKQAITISFGIVKFPLPELANGVILLGCFLAGCLVSFVLGLARRYKSYKKFKIVNELVETQKQKITEMAKNIESLKSASAPQPSIPEDTGGHGPDTTGEEPDDDEPEDVESEDDEAGDTAPEEETKD